MQAILHMMYHFTTVLLGCMQSLQICRQSFTRCIISVQCYWVVCSPCRYAGNPSHDVSFHYSVTGLYAVLADMQAILHMMYYFSTVLLGCMQSLQICRQSFTRCIISLQCYWVVCSPCRYAGNPSHDVSFQYSVTGLYAVLADMQAILHMMYHFTTVLLGCMQSLQICRQSFT